MTTGLAPRSRLSARLALLLAAGLLVLGAHQAGILHWLGDPALLKAALVGQGAWGWLIFVATYALLQPFGVPGTVFVFAAPLIWPWPLAFALSMVGTMAASVIGFSFARVVARDWVAARIPPRFAAYDRALAERGFATVVTLRFVFWMPQMLHAFLGVSQVPFWTHFWGSLLGYLPPLLATAYFGAKVFDWAKELSLGGWLGLAAGWAGLIAVVWWLRRWRGRKEVEHG